jgi:multiple sugar transport system substrate-binding protein
MHLFKKALLASTILAASASLATAQSVKWNADGGADLIMDDGTVITAGPGDLGSLFGPGEKPFDGVEITITVNAGGPKGGISGPLHSFRPIWEELSGGKLNIVELPFAEHFTKMTTDLRTGTGQFDAFMVGAFWYGDIASGNYYFPINDLLDSDEYPQWSIDSMPASLQTLHTWGDDIVGTLNDADGQVMYYRRDILEDPVWRARYQAETGNALVVPPRTWQQVLEYSQFFDGKNWDDADTDADDGMVLHLKVGEQGHFHFQSLSASFVINPGPEVTQYDNVYWFDPTDMAPLINSPGHVAALEFLQELNKTGPAAQVGWSLGEAWDYFLRGKSIFVFSWGDVGSLVQDTSRSAIKGKMGASILPSSDRYWDFETKQWVTGAGDRLVGNTTGGSWHGVISAFSANPEATYSMLSLMAIKPVSIWNANNGWTGVDPGYKYQFLAPLGEATLADYAKAGWDTGDVEGYLTAYFDNFNAPSSLTYLRIPGTFEYWDIMDKNLSSAMSGQLTAQRALDATADAWKQITARLGQDEQLRLYRSAIGYGG